MDTCDDGVPFQDRVEDLWLTLKARWQHAQIRLVLINVPSFVPPCQQVQHLTFEDLPGEPPEAWRGKDVQWATAFESLGLPASTAAPPLTGKPSPDESV